MINVFRQKNSDESQETRLNTARDFKISSVMTYVTIFILMLSSLRGGVVINSNIPSNIVYGFSSLLLIILSVYGYFKRTDFKSHELISLRNYILVSMLVGVYFLVSDFILGGSVDIAWAYVFLLPYIVFAFLRIPIPRLHLALAVVAIGISLSVMDNYLDVSNGPTGVQNVFDYNAKLRPDLFEAFSRTGDFYRVGGYTGSYHDSANILGMLGSFFFVQYLVKRKLSDFVIAVVSLISMTLTQSAANIVIAIFTCLVFSLYLIIYRRNVKFFFGFVLLLFALFFIVQNFPELTIFTVRLSEEGGSKGMFNMVSLEIFLSPFFYAGHGYAFKSEFVDTEVGFLKDVIQFGLIHTALIYWILLYPVYLFLRVKPRCIAALPYVAAICFAFLSLSHYGSLFRSTNIGLFYAIYAACLANLLGKTNTGH